MHADREIVRHVSQGLSADREIVRRVSQGFPASKNIIIYMGRPGNKAIKLTQGDQAVPVPR